MDLEGETADGQCGEVEKGTPLFLLGGDEVHNSVKFQNSLSRLWGEGGQSDGGRGGRVRRQEPTELRPLAV